MRRVARLAAAALVALPLVATAQPSPEAYVQESWTVREGLPVNSVQVLRQARDGYLWIATLDGLVRFDGARFTVYNASNSALPSNRIVGMQETRDGTLWLTTELGHFVRMRRDTFVVVGRVEGTAAVPIVDDGAGNVWVGTLHGLAVVRDTTLRPVASSTIRGHVTTLARRADGSILAASTTDGVFHVVDARAGRVERWATPQRFGGDSIVAMLADRADALWLTTSRGVWRWRGPPSDSAPTLVMPSINQRYWSAELVEAPNNGDIWVNATNGVWRIPHDAPRAAQLMVERDVGSYVSGLVFPDSGGRMYAGGTYSMFAVDASGRSARPNAPVATTPSALTWGVIDHEGSLWLATQATGLYRTKPAPVRVLPDIPNVSAQRSYVVTEARDGSIWYGVAGSVVRVANGASRVVPMAWPVDWVRALHETRDGYMWVGGQGLSRCTPDLHCEAMRGPGDLPYYPNVVAIDEAPDGTLLLGTTFGLYRYAAGAWSRVAAREGAPETPARAFLRDHDGVLWMGTTGSGLTRWDRGTFRTITTADGLPSNLVRSLHQDADGWLWVGTEGRGLARLDPGEWAPGHRGRIASVTQRDGLFDDVVHVILEDDQGRMWFNGNRGISWVDRRALLAFADGKAPNVIATSYTERDGMRNREGNGGSQPAGVKAHDGTLWFPTQGGIAIVDPARIRRNLVRPPVVVEQVQRRGVGGRDLEIAYTAMSFVAPANVRFRYRLEPYDRDWVEAGARRTAFYTRVPPGDYTFHVIASNNDGVWNERGATMAIAIAPRLWETTAFRLAALLGLVALGVFAAQWRVRALQARTATLERTVDARTRELRERNAQLADLHDSRSRLFANLSHEFRTPLTLILGPVRSLLDGRYGEIAPALREQGELMQRNGQRLLRLINQVLDLARLQSGAVALDRQPHDLAAFARATTLAFAPLAERRRITLTVLTDEDALPVTFDAEQLEKVLLNLLSNALKFTEPSGRVEVGVARDGDAAVIRVRDTGVGISAEQLPLVFDRYYQADASTTRRYEGTGIGLALARELVELHGGSIDVASVLGEGSTFTVRLPLGGVDADTALAMRRAVSSVDTDAHEAAIGVAPAPEIVITSEHAVPDVTTVLLVDDNADVRAYVRSLLADVYRVLEAPDGRAGLAVARSELPDLIVADVMMPELDGLALGRALKEEAMTDAIPLVLLSARAASEDQVAGLETGADAYLTKPFEPSVLVATVGTLLAQRRRLRDRFERDGGNGARLPSQAREPGSGAWPQTAPAPDRPAIDLRLRPIVESRLTDGSLDANTLAEAAGLSYHQLYRALRDEMQVSPSRYIRTVRVECAAELLKRGTGSVTEIAYSVGFESLSYFSRAFSERFGASPSTFVKERGTV